MFVIMRLVSVLGVRLNLLSVGHRAGICILALWIGWGTPVLGISSQRGLRLTQETLPNQQDQTQGQTSATPQNPAHQPTPGGEQGQAETGSPTLQAAQAEQGDEMLAGIQAVLATVSAPDLAILGQAFHAKIRKQGEATNESSAVELVDLGDLDGDGVPEVALKLPVTEASREDSQGQVPPHFSPGLFLLSWDGTRWRASLLAATAEKSQFKVVRLGKTTGRCIAVVNVVGEEALPYPAIFQVREHAAAVLWDSQGEDNSYNAFGHGQIEFQDNAKLDQTDMIVTGRADPGLLQFEPGGHRGFSARCVYHWDGQAYVPAQTEYSPGPDNSLYRFIAALHLHDFRSAYALIDPGKFLQTDAPSLEKFRRMMEENWQEFLDDQIFKAREPVAGSPDTLAFELPEKHYVYLPTLSTDGRFLLLGLERKVEIQGTGSAGDSP